MSRKVSAFEARSKFGEILDAVRYRKEPCIVERNGRPAVVIVDVEAYRAMESLLEEEQFIEDYTQERVKEFLTEDHLSREEAQRIRRSLKPSR